jgi:hypothetical protein
MRQRKPRVDLVGVETGNGIVIAVSDEPNKWIVECDCGSQHYQASREIRKGVRPKCCSNFKPHNYLGIDRWDAIIRRNYGITLAEYECLLKSQDGGCAICGKTPKDEGRRLAIDHCHRTGNVRGILCANCNQAIGLFNDSVTRIINASEYVSNFKTATAR